MTTNIQFQASKAKLLIKENKFSLDTWINLVKNAQEANIDDSREFFEELVNEFQTCGRFWKTYIEQELNTKNYDRVDKLFKRCLDKVINIDLWKCYLTFIRETTIINSLNACEKLFEAYNQALDKIGLDVMSYSVWQDYVNLVKSIDVTDSFTANVKENKIRSIYKKGINNPMINVEQFWKDYALFENQLSLVDESNKDYVNIKRVAREYENVTRPLERHMPAIPPQGTNDELKQILAWKRYISWEKQNPLKSDDRNYVLQRVMFAYEQSFLCLAYHPDIWHEAANYLNQERKTYLNENNKIDANKLSIKIENLYEKALETFMKESVLLYFAYADYQESLSNFDKCEMIYKRCIDNVQSNITLVYINYMRFMRRAKGIKAARDTFKLGREDKRTTYQLYIAAAEMEYYCTKDKQVPLKIFQLGAKKFPNSNEFMLAYIKYMDHLNEDNNTRVLFERFLTSEELPKEGINKIWSKFLEFECYCGDLASVLKVDKKRQKALESSLEDKLENTLIIDRYKFLDLLPCNTAELKSMGYKDLKPVVSLNATSSTINTTNTLNQPIAAKLLNNANINNLNELTESNILKLKSKYPLPDEMQMLPFKPVRNALPGSHTVPGGVFPFPPTVTELVKKLPPPNMFQGPFVIIDELMKKFNLSEVTEDYQPNYVYVNGEPIRDMEQINAQQQTMAAKRLLQLNNDSDEEDTKKTKVMDIFKQRQHKKLAKN